MSLESIVNSILHNAHVDAGRIIKQAQDECEKLMQQAQKEATEIYTKILEEEKALCAKEKEKFLVQARLESRKNLLKAKQESIDTVFVKLESHLGKGIFKKEQVSHEKVHEVGAGVDFFLDKLRINYEVEVARILFA